MGVQTELHANFQMERNRADQLAESPVAECHFSLLPKHHALSGGQLIAILRGAVHHDATISVSFIDRNVAEILCTKNRAPSFISFLGAMGAKVVPDFKTEAESSERGRNRNSTTSNHTTCLLRAKRAPKPVLSGPASGIPLISQRLVRCLITASLKWMFQPILLTMRKTQSWLTPGVLPTRKFLRSTLRVLIQALN
jgi:hypothetical protein